MKDLIHFLLSIHQFLASCVDSKEAAPFFSEFDAILVAFLQTQMKSFFPIRSSAEMTLFSQLFSLLISCIEHSTVKDVVDLLGVVRTLLPRNQDEATVYVRLLPFI